MNLFKKLKEISISLILIGSLISCNTTKKVGKGAIYYDTRGKPTATFVGGASNLPLGTDLFGFVELQTEKENLDNLKEPYTEVRLSKKVNNNLGIAIEYNRDFSLHKGTTRVGFLYEPDLSKVIKNSFIGVKLYPASTNNQGKQIGLYGNKNFNSGNIYLEGFLEYNFKPDKTVAELQFGKKIRDNLYFVIKGRYNGFITKTKEEIGIGIGLEQKF